MNKGTMAFASGCALAVSVLAQNAGTLAEQYRESASKLIDASLSDQGGMEKLTYLCDRIGNRLSGSAALEKAVAWAAAQMKADGLVQRGYATRQGSPLGARHRKRRAAGAGERSRSPCSGWAAASRRPSGESRPKWFRCRVSRIWTRRAAQRSRARSCSSTCPMKAITARWFIEPRGRRVPRDLGAVAALVRSVTPVSLQSPHTGALEYADGFPKIPAAAVTIEDALLIQRLADAGNPVVAHLEMEAHMLPDADSANVIGEIPGRERPDEVVVIGGHFDSWDVGAGAQDDGSGCITALEAAHIIHAAGPDAEADAARGVLDQRRERRRGRRGVSRMGGRHSEESRGGDRDGRRRGETHRLRLERERRFADHAGAQCAKSARCWIASTPGRFNRAAAAPISRRS